MIWFVLTAAVFDALFFASAWEPRHRPARPSFGPLCHCGCGRPVEQHNPMRTRLTNLIGRYL